MDILKSILGCTSNSKLKKRSPNNGDGNIKKEVSEGKAQSQQNSASKNDIVRKKKAKSILNPDNSTLKSATSIVAIDCEMVACANGTRKLARYISNF